MDLTLSPEQRALQDSTRRLVERSLQPVLDAHDPDRPLPKAAMQAILEHCAGQGLTSARVPETAGGSGMRMVDLGLVYELLPPAILFGLISQEVTVARVHAESTPAIRERFLPDLVAARRITCTATTEPGTGSDPRSVRTRAVRDGEDWVIDGRKQWISNATICDVVNVTVSVGEDARGLAKLMRILVERDASPFESSAIETLGLRQAHLGEMAFADCRVPAANALGEPGDAARILTLTWLGNRPLIGMAAVGMAQRALDRALEYAGEREVFGRRIAGHQLVQERLVDIAEAVVTSRLLCLHALATIDAGERANQISAMAKRYAVRACERAIDGAMHVHGAMGVSRDLGLEQAWRDVRMLPIPDGTDEILTLIAGRELTGIAAYRG